MMFETEMSSTSPYAKFAGVSSVTSTSLDGTPYERTTTPAALRGATTVEHIDSRTAGTTPCGAAHGGRGAAALAEAGDGKRPAATSAAKASARDIRFRRGGAQNPPTTSSQDPFCFRLDPRSLLVCK